MKKNIVSVIAILIVTTVAAFAQAIPSRPVPPRLVNDYTSTLTKQQASFLESKLVAYNDTTSTQIAVVFVADFQGTDIMDFGVKLFDKWGIGTQKNNGCLILVKPKSSSTDGEVAIIPGYGLEEYITDAMADVIIRKEMIPYFRENDYFTAVNRASDVIIGLATGAFTADDYKNGGEELKAIIVFFILMFVIVIILTSKGKNGGNNGGNGGNRAFWTGVLLGGMPRGGGFHGGGGGFGGFGGGMTGGGGAHGRW